MLRRSCEVVLPVTILRPPGALQCLQILPAALIHDFPYRPEDGKLYPSRTYNPSQIYLSYGVLKAAGNTLEQRRRVKVGLDVEW